MTKGTGLGARFCVGGYDISGDVQAIDNVHGGPATLDVTDITQSAHSRLPGLRDGGMDFTVYFDKLGAHIPLSALPLTNTIASFIAPPMAVGGVMACCNGKQINYDPTRDQAGNLTLKVQVDASVFGLEWGAALTAGTRTDTGAANGTTFDNGAPFAFGAQAYLQALALTGTDVTVTIQHSANNSTWSTLMAFTEIVSAGSNLPPSVQRISVSNTTTVNRYLRVITTTAGGFTSFAFVAMVNVNQAAGVTF